ncbi:hypothetical protein ER308_11215 [Egibacter rhizosphaerae]|uniref:DSBA-like thioredoxin domain-containing protein n=2 Tax=Egibacter rhizosphaerae TaxID=1670831 RepID=A0A411YFN5_9ACTN|nr:hypothetical protein ER308_11215 [Egibacter rhizosphaerae]
MLSRQDRLARNDLLAYAGELGLDVDRVTCELSEGTHRPRVREDVRSGVASGVAGTPTLFLGGERRDDLVDAYRLMSEIEDRLGPVT